MSERRGFLLVLLTATVSGFAIFANNFAVKGINPFAFVFLKNAVVAAFLFSLILLLKELPAIKRLSRSQWLKLAAIGLLGGSIPFLLFFYALQLSNAINAGFLHKTLFVWATAFAFLFLKEKPDKRFIAAAIILLAGNFVLFSIGSFGLPELLILLATMLWAAENTLSKHILKQASGSIVAFGRMFFGSLFILAFLGFTNQAIQIFALSQSQIHWVLLTSCFLLAYVFTFYSGLRLLPVHKATAVLLLGQPITIFLSFAFLGTGVSVRQAFGFLLILAGVFLAFGLGFVLHEAKSIGFTICSQKKLTR